MPFGALAYTCLGAGDLADLNPSDLAGGTEMKYFLWNFKSSIKIYFLNLCLKFEYRKNF